MNNHALHLPRSGRPGAARRAVRTPLITALMESAGVPRKPAEQVAATVIRAWLGYLPEPLQTRVRCELSKPMRRAVGCAGFPQGNRFADPALFVEQVARDSGLRLYRAKALSQAVLEEWSRQVTHDLLVDVAGYMPALFATMLPALTDLVPTPPPSPLRLGPALPLCTAPTDPDRRWRSIEATFRRLRLRYSGASLKEIPTRRGVPAESGTIADSSGFPSSSSREGSTGI